MISVILSSLIALLAFALIFVRSVNRLLWPWLAIHCLIALAELYLGNIALGLATFCFSMVSFAIIQKMLKDLPSDGKRKLLDLKPIPINGNVRTHVLSFIIVFLVIFTVIKYFLISDFAFYYAALSLISFSLILFFARKHVSVLLIAVNLIMASASLMIGTTGFKMYPYCIILVSHIYLVTGIFFMSKIGSMKVIINVDDMKELKN